VFQSSRAHSSDLLDKARITETDLNVNTPGGTRGQVLSELVDISAGVIGAVYPNEVYCPLGCNACSSVHYNQRFRGTRCLNLQGRNNYFYFEDGNIYRE
jgi:hypothetical protein